MRSILTFSTLLLLSGQALASGGIWCETEAAPAQIDVHGGVSRGMGGQLFSFEGKVAIADMTVPEDLRKLEFTREHVAQYWYDNKAVNLVLYRERDADKLFGSLEITIETTALEGDDNEGAYAGDYSVMVAYATDDAPEGKQIDLSGKIKCFAD